MTIRHEVIQGQVTPQGQCEHMLNPVDTPLAISGCAGGAQHVICTLLYGLFSIPTIRTMQNALTIGEFCSKCYPGTNRAKRSTHICRMHSFSL